LISATIGWLAAILFALTLVLYFAKAFIAGHTFAIGFAFVLVAKVSFIVWRIENPRRPRRPAHGHRW